MVIKARFVIWCQSVHPVPNLARHSQTMRVEAIVSALLEYFWKADSDSSGSSPEQLIALKAILAIYFRARPLIHLGDILDVKWGNLRPAKDTHGRGGGMDLILDGRTYYCPRLRDPMMCPTSAMSMHTVTASMSGLGFGPDMSDLTAFTKRYLFPKADNPNESMDLDLVLQHFGKALRATGHQVEDGKVLQYLEKMRADLVVEFAEVSSTSTGVPCTTVFLMTSARFWTQDAIIRAFLWPLDHILCSLSKSACCWV